MTKMMVSSKIIRRHEMEKIFVPMMQGFFSSMSEEDKNKRGCIQHG